MAKKKSSELTPEVLKGAADAARRKAFKKNLPVAILKDGNVVLVYKDKSEIIVTSSTQKQVQPPAKKNISRQPRKIK
ncbi:hypothetical protein LPTSP3_g21430 [Leptospira kobayashii]|uniref:Uncharacterized protein n=1 Tax=Leptospira kobayashii TaxID=1917830 RepID=A0ABM7UJZ9_9LEPT|nr:hypothetical protein [Leptospira kobayashii]BDA79213.1 hypothetical protein LPTSP3_g21430 [Leptospira kobayashii]